MRTASPVTDSRGCHANTDMQHRCSRWAGRSDEGGELRPLGGRSWPHALCTTVFDSIHCKVCGGCDWCWISRRRSRGTAPVGVLEVNCKLPNARQVVHHLRERSCGLHVSERRGVEWKRRYWLWLLQHPCRVLPRQPVQHSCERVCIPADMHHQVSALSTLAHIYQSNSTLDHAQQALGMLWC